MRNFYPLSICLLFIMIMMSSCELVGDIFKAGFTTAIVVVLVIIGLIFWLIKRK